MQRPNPPSLPSSSGRSSQVCVAERSRGTAGQAIESKVGALVRFLDPRILDFLLVNHTVFDLRLAQMASLVSSSQIIEEVYVFLLGSYEDIRRPISTAFFDYFVQDGAYGMSSASMKDFVRLSSFPIFVSTRFSLLIVPR